MSESKLPQRALQQALDWVVEIDVPALQASVESMRDERPDESRRQLATRIFSKAQWKAAATGAVTGLPANPWTAAPAALGDVAITLRTEVTAVAKVALLYEPGFFDDDEAIWELLVPVFGINLASQLMRELAIRGGMGLTRELLKSYLSKAALESFKRIVLKYFGKKVTQKAVITKTLPVVGLGIGAAWNWLEVKALRKRTFAYFEDQELET